MAKLAVARDVKSLGHTAIRVRFPVPAPRPFRNTLTWHGRPVHERRLRNGKSTTAMNEEYSPKANGHPQPISHGRDAHATLSESDMNADVAEPLPDDSNGDDVEPGWRVTPLGWVALL